MNNAIIVDLIKKYESTREINWDNAIEISKKFLELLLECEIQDNFPRACVRYLIFTKGWPMSLAVSNRKQWNDVMDKFFAVHTNGAKHVTDNYFETTKNLILESFNVDIPTPEIKMEPVKASVKKTTAKKTTRKPKVAEEGESGSKVFKSVKESLAE